jgi:rhodanese-related sulfurtransferase
MGFFSRKGKGKGDQVDPVEAKQLLDDGALLVDVREPHEYQAGHAPKAKHIALGVVGHRQAELPKDRTIVLVCRSGRRSDQAATQLRAADFTVVNLKGGMQAWQAAGLPVVAKGGKAGRVA